jgi:hypothetical protein
VTQNGKGNHAAQVRVKDPFARPRPAPRSDARGAASEAPVLTAEATASVSTGTKIRTGSLVVVSTGMMAVNHVTVEAQGWIKHADRVFCWGLDPVTERWISGLNGNVKPLKNVGELAEHAHEFLRAGLTVCAVHAGDSAPWREEIRLRRAEGFRVAIVPCVSAEDCLFSDLGIDPLRDGVQIYAAADFLARHRTPDLSAGLVLRLAGCAGDSASGACPPQLAELLAERYGKEHEAILYEPARYAVCEPSIRRCPVGDLATVAAGAGASLFVPAKEPRGEDRDLPPRHPDQQPG